MKNFKYFFENYKNFCMVFLTISLLLTIFISPVNAVSDTPVSEKDLVKREIFKTTDENKKYDFAESIEENGKKYNLKAVNYEILSSEALMREEVVENTVDYKDLYKKDVTAAETLEIIKDGKPLTVNLKGVEYTPTIITNRTEIVSSFTDYSYKTVKPEPAETKTVTYHDYASGEDIISTLTFKELKEEDGWDWRNDVTIPITFTIYNAEYYALGDKLVPYNHEKPALSGYETDILNELKLDTEKYRINSFEWDEEPYYIGEVQYRKAVAKGERYAAHYIAVYESNVKLPDVPGYNAVAKYQNTVDVESGERNYEMQATAIYTRDYTSVYIAGGVALALFSIAFLVILIL
ncbi:MAG: hypothetical protein K2H01_12510, partial [Ruminococcus sp.]|nr:hypothetical protein [Ruminococcus sp.]